MKKIEPIEKCTTCGNECLYFCYDEDTWQLVQVCYDCGTIHVLGTVSPLRILNESKGKGLVK